MHIGCAGGGVGSGTLQVLASDSPFIDVLPTLNIATPAPTNSIAPSESATADTPEPSPTPSWALFKSRVNVLNIRTVPSLDGDSTVVGTLGYEETARVVGIEGDFYRIWTEDNQFLYCYKPFMVAEFETLYGYVPPQSEIKTDKDGNIVYEDDGVTPVELTAELVDVRLFIDNIEIYQIFGTDQNITGSPLYSRPVPVLQRGTAQKLAMAASVFAKDGYTIKLYDCYRPKSVQFILYDIVQDSRYIANPYTSASNHNRAAAVDISLIGPDGRELEFPTPMHTFTMQSNRNCETWTDEQTANVDYMTRVMIMCGFQVINSEWWHFSDTDYKSYMVLDIDMASITMYTAEQLGYSGATISKPN